MAKKAGESISKAINGFAKLVGQMQVAVNKVLWGRGNNQPAATAKYDKASGNMQYTSTPPPPPTPPKTKAGDLIGTGLFNALDALNQVDLCDVMTYVASNVKIKKKPRRPKEQWTAVEKKLYQLQDYAGDIVRAIDKYEAYPNTFIGQYAGIGPNAISAEQAVKLSGTNSTTDSLSGTNVGKYNMYNLIKSIQDTLSPTGIGSNSLFSAEDRQTLGMIPGIGNSLNVIDDFVANINKYADYRSISSNDLIKLQNQITKIRTVCVAIQTLDLQSGLALAGNFLGVDIRSQIQKLNKYLDVTKIIPTLRKINNAIKSFIAMGKKIQNIIRTAQFIIKVLVLIVKIFKFIIAFFKTNPFPLIFATSGIQSSLDTAKKAAEDQTDSVTLALKQLNGLLAVVLIFVRYLLTNSNELLIRLQTLLTTLEGCEAMKDSDILAELQQTATELESFKEQLVTYITAYDSKTNSDEVLFGKYTIRVVDEEVTDRSISNKRRRGIAFDQYGAIVAQSDLTFATNNITIINEVKLKLINLGLAPGNTAVLDAAQAAILAESLGYLDDDSLSEEGYTLLRSEYSMDPPDNEDEDDGLGLNAFVNKLKGGKRLRRRARRAMAAQKRQVANQLRREDPSGTLTAQRKLNASAAQDAIAGERANIGVLREDIALLALTLPSPTAIALIAQKNRQIKASNDKIREWQRLIP